MEYNILSIGDVVGEPGLRHLEKHLRSVQKLKNIRFTVVNGENASGVGLTPDQAWRIYDAGADAVTLGNHAFGKMQLKDFIEDTRWLLRPANFTGRMPGHGCEIFEVNGLTVRVINLIGRCDLAWGAENPFTTVDRLLGEEPLLRRNYLRYLSGRIRFLSGRLQSVTQSGSEGKLARYLLANAVDGPVNISATDLARQLGLSRASLYRAFDALEQADLIRRSGKAIEVPSLPALQSVL